MMMTTERTRGRDRSRPRDGAAARVQLEIPKVSEYPCSFGLNIPRGFLGLQGLTLPRRRNAQYHSCSLPPLLADSMPYSLELISRTILAK
jgi:hypothetical protein